MISLDKFNITLKKLNGIILKRGSAKNTLLANSIGLEMAKFGFFATRGLIERFASQSDDTLAIIWRDLLAYMKQYRGAEKDYAPMYPNFPEQVMQASDAELFFNALVHYHSAGEWMPAYEAWEREEAYETTGAVTIGLVTNPEFYDIFAKILLSNESISADDKAIVKWFIATKNDKSYPDSIPYKENMSIVFDAIRSNGGDAKKLVKSATDVLRVITAMSGGDVSLAENTKFKSLSKADRRFFAGLIEEVATPEDLKRHKNKWKRLFHMMHIGGYSKKLFEMAKKIREDEPVETFARSVEAAIKARDVDTATTLLAKRPGEFARRLDKILRDKPSKHKMVTHRFGQVADKIPTRVAAQVKGHFKGRLTEGKKGNTYDKIVFPKGNTQKCKVIPCKEKPFSDAACKSIIDSLDAAMKYRFAELPSLGKVYIDPDLDQCPLPTQMRSASSASRSVARGTRLPFGDETKNTLRFFVFWTGMDIDLSASFYDEDFKHTGHISYTQLRGTQGCHSGDITYAPYGASEFIDINIPYALSMSRYVAMNVYVYNGPSFGEHEECFAGWMTKANPDMNPILDARTVENRFDLKGNGRSAIPVIFDMKERKAIWTDLYFKGNTRYNNIESASELTSKVIKAIVSTKNKTTLYELFSLHAEARGELVETQEEADTVFSLKDGVTPLHIDIINSEFLI